MPFPSEQQSKCKKQKQVNNKYKCKIQIEKKKKITSIRDFPGSPVVKNLAFQCRGHEYKLWSGN